MTTATESHRITCKISKMGNNLVIWIPKDQQTAAIKKLKGKPLIATLEVV